MSNLRAQQKQDRRNRIVTSAKELFREKGYDKTTIEAIAVAAGVSGVTVHNYYGTKAGVLLALVIESDKQLLERLDSTLPGPEAELVELTVAFAHEIMVHAMQTLEKDIWRQVIAAVTIEAGTQLSKAYFKLDEQLASVLVRRIEAMQRDGRLSADLNPLHLGRALFQLQNARFIQFISTDAARRDEIETWLRNDLVALFSVMLPVPADPS